MEITILRGEAPPFSGYGDGYGDGYGSGSGYGYGSGSGDGYGYGSGYGEYWSKTISGFAAKWPKAQQDRLAVLRDGGAKIAFWRSTNSGGPANGGKSVTPAAPGIVHTITGRLVLCENALHATLLPPKWKGDRWWVVALTGQVEGDDEKYGALTREIIGEAL